MTFGAFALWKRVESARNSDLATAAHGARGGSDDEQAEYKLRDETRKAEAEFRAANGLVAAPELIDRSKLPQDAKNHDVAGAPASDPASSVALTEEKDLGEISRLGHGNAQELGIEGSNEWVRLERAAGEDPGILNLNPEATTGGVAGAPLGVGAVRRAGEAKGNGAGESEFDATLGVNAAAAGAPGPFGGSVAPSPFTDPNSGSGFYGRAGAEKPAGAAPATPGTMAPTGGLRQRGGGGGGLAQGSRGLAKEKRDADNGEAGDGEFKGRTENFFEEVDSEESPVEPGFVPEAVGGRNGETEVTGADLPGAAEDKATRGGELGGDDLFLGRKEQEQSVEQMRRQLEVSRLELLRRDCLPRRREAPRDMFFRFWGDNPFEYAAIDHLSTFSADVDTASYALARSYLTNGQLPGKAQIRTEEFVNYFKGDVAPPTSGTFAIATELAPSLFGESSAHWMLRVALRGREVSKRERMPLCLTFVVDVSGSMQEEHRLELVKEALRLLVAQLDARDTIALVKFSADAALVLPPTSAKHRDLIESAIYPLQPDGGTNTEAGLRMGYAQAVAALTKDANNRVVLLTDGVANVGVTDPEVMAALVERQRSAGILLNTIGVGMDNHNDNLLEQLADKGDGLCNYVDDEKEVRRALVDNFTGAFEAIARDVKIQVDFDPAQVERYRLLGYENRAIADQDFRNDKIDAAEMGAGHQVVALYEIVRKAGVTELPFATVNVRWKSPYNRGVAEPSFDAEAVHEMKVDVRGSQAAGGFLQTSAGYRRSVLVAQFAEFLRRSVHARRDSLDRLIDESKRLASAMNDADFNEFVALVERSRALVVAENSRRDWIDDCGDLLRHHCYLQAQIEQLRRRLGDQERLDEGQLGGAAQRGLDARGELDDMQRRLDDLRARIEGTRSQADQELIANLQAENIELQRRLLDLLERWRTKAK